MSDARKSDAPNKADSLAEVRDHFRKAEVRLDSNDVWAIQGTPVVKHRALERLAAALKIKFEKLGDTVKVNMAMKAASKAEADTFASS